MEAMALLICISIIMQVERQTIQASFQSDIRQRYTLFVQGVNTRVVLNDPTLVIADVSLNETVGYSRSTRNVVLTDTDTMLETTYSGIDTFTFLDASGNAGQPNALIATEGPGNLFVQGSSATFSKAVGLNSQIEDTIPIFPAIIIPPPPIEILVADRFAAGVNNLVLNIDSTMAPDMIAQPTDDIIELTGSFARVLTGEQTIIQNPVALNTMLVIFGIGGPTFFPDIARFYTLLFVSRGGVTGPELAVYTPNQLLPRSLSGPGILRTGKQGGQDVAFFTNIGEVNMQISRDLVRMLLEFRVMDSTAEILSRYGDTMGQRLVMLNGAQSFSYPDATVVRLEGTALSVSSGANLLQRFDSGTAPTVSAFVNHEIVRSMVAPLTISIPEGGATLYFNMDDNEVFVFPSRNQIIGENITAALAQAEITPTITTAEYSFISTPFGMATLVAKVEGTVGDAVEVVQVAPGTTILDLGTGSFLSYKGMTIEVFDNNGMPLQSFSGVSPLTVNEQGFEYLSDTNNFTAIFGGPGRLYVDSEDPRRAFYTQNPAIQNQITSFVSGLPDPTVEIVRNPTTGIVSFQTGGQNLFTLNGARAVTARPDQAGIYFNNRISVVNAFKVPDNAQASYTTADGRVRVPDPNNPGSFLFDLPIMNNLWEFDGVSTSVLSTASDRMFGFRNGYIYYGDNGILVAATNGVNDGVSRILTNDGALHSSAADIPSILSPQLTVFDDRSIVTFTGTSNNLLPRGGTYYGSADGNSSIYIRNVGFNNRVGGIYSQLNPAISSYNGTTGVVTVTTAEGRFISSLRPGTTETVSVDRNGFIRYAGGEITFDPAVRGAVDGITSLVVWDGLTANMFGITDNITFSGPGIFWFEGGTAFYTSDPTTLRQVTQRINSVMTTFRQPFISRTPRTFREKFRTVRGGFPQTIDVYDGADVILNCTVLASNPAPVISFERRFFNETSNMFEFDTFVDGESAMITQVGNTAILTIMNILRDDNINAYNGTGVFRCIASNFAGSDDVTTTVNVLPAGKSVNNNLQHQPYGN